jgi:signal transduction histidine kinase
MDFLTDVNRNIRFSASLVSSIRSLQFLLDSVVSHVDNSCMLSRTKRTIVFVIFTVVIILLVNLAWWLFYSRTEQSFENQLSHRLAAIAYLGCCSFPPDLVGSLADGYLSAYDSTLEILDRIKTADSLSEVFVIDQNYKYLATTQLESDSIYYLAALNSMYIDSIFSLGWSEETDIGSIPIVTESYQVGEVILKSAFAPLIDTSGATAAVLGIEADVDYTEALLDLRHNLYFSTFLSVCGGLIFGLFFFLIQRRINATEKSLFISQSQANLGRMVAVVSHEVKNPLMIIRASAERLQKAGAGGAREADFIIEETDRLNSIVSGYLDFASGRKELKLQPVTLDELLSKIVEQFGPKLKQSGVTLKFTRGDSKAKANIDPVALRQIIINLILNGADAVKGRNDGEVVLANKTSGYQTIITVTDNGSGLDSKQKKMIFEPFYTTKASGSGLGLYYSKKLIGQMKGEIKLESKPGGPTKFSIILPTAVEK